MRIITIALIFLFPQLTEQPTEETLPALETEFPVRWKTEMGGATFRTNINFTNETIVIGSNGRGYKDAGFFDKLSGVYVIDRKTGRIRKHFANEKLGDMDVNGLLIYDNKYYFGNDNEEFLCTDLNGNILWRNPASGDIEHEPLLLDILGKKAILYASETGEARTVDPLTGKLIWDYYTPEFEGYKTGDNRMIFKVKSYFTNTRSFLTKPELADLNCDGVDDPVYLTWNNRIVAINGLNGKLLWQYQADGWFGNDLLMSHNENGPVFITSEYKYSDRLNETFGRLLIIGTEGQVLEKRRYNISDFVIGLNHFSNAGDSAVISINDSLYFIKDGRVARTLYHYSYYPEGYYDNTYGQKFTEDALFGSAIFPYKGHARCLFRLNQDCYRNTGEAFAEILSLDDGTVLSRFSIPSSGEMEPQIRDVDRDGYLDLLINYHNGELYCYNMKIKVR